MLRVNLAIMALTYIIVYIFCCFYPPCAYATIIRHGPKVCLDAGYHTSSFIDYLMLPFHFRAHRDARLMLIARMMTMSTPIATTRLFIFWVRHENSYDDTIFTMTLYLCSFRSSSRLDDTSEAILLMHRKFPRSFAAPPSASTAFDVSMRLAATFIKGWLAMAGAIAVYTTARQFHRRRRYAAIFLLRLSARRRAPLLRHDAMSH